jgi:hypothetical protein
MNGGGDSRSSLLLLCFNLQILNLNPEQRSFLTIQHQALLPFSHRHCWDAPAFGTDAHQLGIKYSFTGSPACPPSILGIEAVNLVSLANQAQNYLCTLPAERLLAFTDFHNSGLASGHQSPSAPSAPAAHQPDWSMGRGQPAMP